MSQRPMFLNLFLIRLPITGLVSILHRISGLFLFLVLPFILYVWELSLKSSEDFANLATGLSHPVCYTIICLIGLAFLYHLLAGIRHLLMDLHFGDSKCVARATSWLVLLLTFSAAAYCVAIKVMPGVI